MRGSLIVVLLILCGYFAYRDYRGREQIRALEKSCAELQRKLEEAQPSLSQDGQDSVTPVPASHTSTLPGARPSGAVHATCPVCRGEGKLMARRQDGRDIPYPCPICLGTGSRDVEVPAGHVLCPDCRGMGRVEAQAARRPGRVYATACRRCIATGVVKKAE